MISSDGFLSSPSSIVRLRLPVELFRVVTNLRAPADFKARARRALGRPTAELRLQEALEPHPNPFLPNFIDTFRLPLSYFSLPRQHGAESSDSLVLFSTAIHLGPREKKNTGPVIWPGPNSKSIKKQVVGQC